MTAHAEIIAEAVIAKLHDHPTPQEVEEVMRPFGVISQQTEHEVDEILRAKGINVIARGIGPWIEANEVVSGTGPHIERRIQFLLRDTCTCVLDHLHTAITHAEKPVDPRILKLREHEYFLKAQKELLSDQPPVDPSA